MSENTIIDIVNESNNINVSELGVTFSENATIEEWERFGEQIGRVVNSSQFIIGDWLNFGRDKWQNREELQERIEIAEKNTGLDARSLQNYASIARRIPMENRSVNCSFDMHRSVAKLDSDDQRKWLKVADERNMTTRVLKASIKAGKPITKEEQKSAQPESVHPQKERRILRQTFRRTARIPARQTKIRCRNLQRIQLHDSGKTKLIRN